MMSDVEELDGARGVQMAMGGDEICAGGARKHVEAAGYLKEVLWHQIENSNIKLLFELQSLLHKFKDTETRADFMAGKLLLTDDPEMFLFSLDVMHELFLPEWSTVAAERQDLAANATYHFHSLCNRSTSTFDIPSAAFELDKHSYASWMRAFGKLRESKYWMTQGSRLKPSAGNSVRDDKGTVVGRTILNIKKSSILSDTSNGSDNVEHEADSNENSTSNVCNSEDDKYGQSCKKKKFSKSHVTLEASTGENNNEHKIRKIQESSMDSDTSTTNNNNNKCRKKKTKKKSKLKKNQQHIETIEISDSSDCESYEDSSDSDLNVACCHKSSECCRKEVVRPEIFKIDGKVPLKQHLDGFERYFDAKYEGTQRDCTRELANFIAGEVREAYESLGGIQRKYKEMKPALLQWYKSHIVEHAQQSKAELMKVCMKPGDTFVLYCMKIKEIAKRAYPSDIKQCLKQLKCKLIDTVPEWFVRSMEEKEELKVMLKLGKKITWEEILELAKKHDKKNIKLKLREEADKELKQRFNHLYRGVKTAEVKSEKVGYEPGNVSRDFHSLQYPEHKEPQMCHFCGRRGHVEDGCWRKSGACTICGNLEHSNRECPRFSSVVGNFVPKCSTCSGLHLGQDCRHRLNRVNQGMLPAHGAYTSRLQGRRFYLGRT